MVVVRNNRLQWGSFGMTDSPGGAPTQLGSQFTAVSLLAARQAMLLSVFNCICMSHLSVTLPVQKLRKAKCEFMN